MRTGTMLAAALLAASVAGAQLQPTPSDPSRGPEADPMQEPQIPGQVGEPQLEPGQETQTFDPKVSELGDRYGFEADEVKGLRDRGYSWRETENALAIAHKAGKPLDEVVAARDRGQSWSDIAEGYGFKLRDAKLKKGVKKEMEIER